MNIGSYPCCDGPLFLAIPEETPAYFKEDCPHCGKPVWHKLSRIDPTTWLAEEFYRLHDVDTETRSIKPKDVLTS